MGTALRRVSDSERRSRIAVRHCLAPAHRKDDVAVVPLAMPLLAGPGAIATVMVLMGRQDGWLAGVPVLVAIMLTFAASYYLLRAAGLVQRVLGQSGVAILQRVMGLILATIAVQFMAEGGRDLLSAGPRG